MNGSFLPAPGSRGPRKACLCAFYKRVLCCRDASGRSYLKQVTSWVWSSLPSWNEQNGPPALQACGGRTQGSHTAPTLTRDAMARSANTLVTIGGEWFHLLASSFPLLPDHGLSLLQTWGLQSKKTLAASLDEEPQGIKIRAQEWWQLGLHYRALTKDQAPRSMFSRGPNRILGRPR